MDGAVPEAAPAKRTVITLPLTVKVLTMSYTQPGTTTVVNRYVPLAAAGLVQAKHDFNESPFAAVFNPAILDTPLEITFSVDATDTDQYVANVAYVLRAASQ